MQAIKDEDRIISRILRGELSFSDSDISNLENADLSEEREEQLSQLAIEIQEKIKQNKQLRKEVEEKAQSAEIETYTKLDLICIEEDLRDLRQDLEVHRNKSKKYKQKIQEKIAKLEQERFGLLGYEKKDMFESDITITKNIVKHIYNSKDLEITEEEIKTLF